jgi:hypothetical protein
MKLRGSKEMAACGFELEHSTSQQRRHPSQNPSPPKPVSTSLPIHISSDSHQTPLPTMLFVDISPFSKCEPNLLLHKRWTNFDSLYTHLEYQLMASRKTVLDDCHQAPIAKVVA